MDKIVFEETMKKEEFILAMERYKADLELSEYSRKTVGKYTGDIKQFVKYLDKTDILHKQIVINYKDFLLRHYKISTVNSYLISLNKYLKWNQKEKLIVRIEKVQKKTCLDRVISREEYQTLLEYLHQNKKIKDYLLIKTLSLTGIRIGELKFITYQAAVRGEASVTFKGKTRTIYLADSLSAQLLEYCRKKGIHHGIIFCGRDTKKALDSSGIWKKMKRIAEKAGIPKNVVYPHSFRHYFAKNFMYKFGNIMELADILGHSSIEMTRIYTMTSSKEKKMMLNQLED